MPAAHAAEAAVIRSHPEPGRSPRGEIRAGASDNYTAVLLLPTDCKEALCRGLIAVGHWPICKRMEFEWDEAKNSACFERRGFDFAYAVRAFLDPHRIVAQDRRRDYGEDRYRLLGTVDGRAYVVVYTVRGSAVRIISARKANGKEVADYEHDAHQD